MSKKTYGPPCVMGDESLMSPKAHGTSPVPVQQNLRWNCDRNKADEICNFNRHYAEHSGYFEKTKFKEEARKVSLKKTQNALPVGKKKKKE